MLGYDVMQVANEGKMVCVVPADEAEAGAGRHAEESAMAPMPPLSGA